MLEDILNVLFHVLAIVAITIAVLYALNYLGQIAEALTGILEVMKNGG